MNIKKHTCDEFDNIAGGTACVRCNLTMLAVSAWGVIIFYAIDVALSVAGIQIHVK